MKIVAEGLGFPEGPAWSERDQRLYLVDWPGNRVLAWDGKRVEHVFSPEPGGGPSGLGLSPQGDFWLCLYDARKLALYSLQGEALLEISNYQGQPFRGVCDLAVDRRGGVYFTDSGDFAEDWRSGRPNGAVYYLSASGELLCVDRDLCFPNGIAVALDGEKLYVNEHRLNRIVQYDLLAEGRFGLRRIFFTCSNDSLLEPESAFELGPDGACIDGDGNVWVAHYGSGKLIQVHPDGRLLRSVPLPRGRMPTNLAYRPAERLLYVTEAEFGLLYQIEV
jgi:gluconolactonase